jgi:hypothetical protein
LKPLGRSQLRNDIVVTLSKLVDCLWQGAKSGDWIKIDCRSRNTRYDVTVPTVVMLQSNERKIAIMYTETTRVGKQQQER